MSQVKSLTGRTALVTGSSSGIGKAIAVRLAAAGASVILHGSRPSDRLDSVCKKLSDAGHRVNILTADFIDLDALKAFLDEAWDCVGGLDILINNAGADVLTGSAADLDFEDKFEQVWQVDVRATLLASRIIGEKMKDAQRPNKSSIVNIGWDQAWQGMAGDSGEMFSASKGAIMSMTKSLAQSLAPHVRVNCVAPGWIKTSWGENASEEWAKRAVSESLMNRWGAPEDVANAVCFLCSDEADFISGHVLPVNGGFKFSNL